MKRSVIERLTTNNIQRVRNRQNYEDRENRLYQKRESLLRKLPQSALDPYPDNVPAFAPECVERFVTRPLERAPLADFGPGARKTFAAAAISFNSYLGSANRSLSSLVKLGDDYAAMEKAAAAQMELAANTFDAVLANFRFCPTRFVVIKSSPKNKKP